MNKRSLLCIILLTVYSSLSFGQQRSEYGGGLGVFNYTGDLTKTYRFLSHRPGGTFYYKYNMSDALSFRASASAGWVYGSDENPYDAFASQRAKTFSVFVFEAAATFEYNFLDFKGTNPLIFGTPYIFGGFGIAGMKGIVSTDGFSPVQPVIPIGIGFKYTLNPHWYLEAQFGGRKLFFDYIDGVSYGDLRYKNYQYGNWLDNDTYFFTGISLTYSVYKILCPKNPY